MMKNSLKINKFPLYTFLFKSSYSYHSRYCFNFPILGHFFLKSNIKNRKILTEFFLIIWIRETGFHLRLGVGGVIAATHTTILFKENLISNYFWYLLFIRFCFSPIASESAETGNLHIAYWCAPIQHLKRSHNISCLPIVLCNSFSVKLNFKNLFLKVKILMITYHEFSNQGHFLVQSRVSTTVSFEK